MVLFLSTFLQLVEYCLVFTDRQPSCEKVMFSVMSVILFGGTHVSITYDDYLPPTPIDPIDPYKIECSQSNSNCIEYLNTAHVNKHIYLNL